MPGAGMQRLDKSPAIAVTYSLLSASGTNSCTNIWYFSTGVDGTRWMVRQQPDLSPEGIPHPPSAGK